MFLLVACGGGGGGSSTPPPPAGTAPAITTQPVSQSVVEGKTATFTVAASGTAPLSYQWHKDSSTISGATNASYTTPATTSADNGTRYSVVVTNSVGSATSTAVTLTVTPAPPSRPSIITQPVNISAVVGSTATFSVKAVGNPTPTYQWTKNGTAIPGAIGTTYTTTALTLTDTGAKFAVVITNSVASVTSASATLTVTAAAAGSPVITSQPANQTVAVGASAHFVVTATGTAPLAYAWKKNGVAIAGANAASYASPAVASTDNGAVFTVTVTNSVGSVTSHGATLVVTAAGGAAPTITTQPAAQTGTVAGTVTFTVVAAGTAPLTYQWSKEGVAIVGAIAATYTTPALTTADDAKHFTVTVTNAAGHVTSAPALLTVPTSSNGSDVTTFKYDVGRSGTNVTETVLTPDNVDASTFGKVGTLTVDGKVDAQPLYLSQFTIGGTAHNVVFVATEHGSVYAFDATTLSATPLWHVNLVPAGSTTSDDLGCTQITPEIGITSTPVIDRTAGAMYVVVMTKDASQNYHHFLHALNLTNGADKVAAVEVQGTFVDVNAATTTFVPKLYEERAALLLTHGQVYLTWTSHCDGYDESVNPNVFTQAYGGWIMSYNSSTLAQTGAINVGPSSADSANTNLTVGPGMWMAGSGPAADSTGSVYLITSNGPFDTTLDGNGSPANGNYSQSFLKLQGADSGALGILDYFSLFNNNAESAVDNDLGSGGGMMLPDELDAGNVNRQLFIGAGKDHNMYIVDRAHLGGFHTDRNHIFQERDNSLLQGIWSSPAYWNGNIFFGPRNGNIQAFTFANASVQVPATSHSATTYAYPGTSPSVSANGSAKGVVWAYEQGTTNAVLHAYDATDLGTQLYNTSTNAGRDAVGPSITFVSPVVTGGKVYVQSTSSVVVYGLLP